MSKRQSGLLIGDIIDSGNKILQYTLNLTFEEFTGDSKTIDAVIRNFEIIGEAANRLTDEFKDKHPQIDRHRMRGFRNRIIHDYFGINYSIVWQIKETYLPELLEKLHQLNTQE